MAFPYAFPSVRGVKTGNAGTSMNSISYAIFGSAGNAGNGNVFFNHFNYLPFPFPWERPFLKFLGTDFC